MPCEKINSLRFHPHSSQASFAHAPNSYSMWRVSLSLKSKLRQIYVMIGAVTG